MGKAFNFFIRYRKRIIQALIVLIFLILLAAAIYFITLDDGTYKDEDMSSTPYAASTYTSSMKFTENGIIFVYKHKDETTDQEVEEEKTSSEMAQILWDEMIKAGSKVENYLSSVEELEKLMNAEIITQYPKIQGLSENKLNGTIEFERHKSDGTSYMLEYVNAETFNNYITSQDTTNSLKYFTLDESGNVLIGIVDKTTEEISTNDSDADISNYSEEMTEPGKVEKYMVSSKPINYKNAISKYTMPFQYLWSLLVIGDDKDFVLELADLVQDSEIVISIYDNITTTVDKEINTYKKQRKQVSKPSTITISGENQPETNNENSENEYKDNIVYNVTRTTTYENNTPLVDLTKADVWIVDFSKEYTKAAPEVAPEQKNETQLEDTEYVEDSDSPKVSNNTNNEEAENKTITHYYTRQTDRKVENIVQITVEKYVEGNVTNNPKVEKDEGQVNFVTLLCKWEHVDAKNKMTSEITSWLFEILENNPDTVNMIDLTKYLFYKVTGRDFGVKEYNFEEYSNNIFSGTYNIYGNTFEEKVWFALIDAGFSEYSVAGAMGNFQQESGFKANNLQGSYENSLGMTDETYTDGVNNGSYTNFVHDSAGYGLAQWTFWTRKQAFLNYTKEKGVGIDDEEAQIGFLIKEINERGCPKWKAATSVEEACYNFEKEFEQAGNPQMGNRLTYAENIYNSYHGQTAPIDVEVNLSGDSKTKMEALLKEAQRIANDDRYTYSKGNRYGEFQYDCSSFVCRLYKKFFDISVPSTTSSYGQSYRIGSASSVTLQPGDVLWRSGHVTLYIGNGKYAAAHGCQGTLANNPAAQITVYNDSPSKYTYVYRFITN